MRKLIDIVNKRWSQNRPLRDYVAILLANDLKEGTISQDDHDKLRLAYMTLFEATIVAYSKKGFKQASYFDLGGSQNEDNKNH